MQPIKEKILESIAPVISGAKHISLDYGRLQVVAKELLDESVPPWDHEMQFLGKPEETVFYYFFLDSLNACFWAPKGKPKWSIEKDGKRVSGYYAFSYAIKRAFESDRRLCDANYLAQIPFEDFSQIFSSEGAEGELLLMEERHHIIQDNFAVIADDFGGDPLRILEEAQYDATKTVELLMERFPSFRDISFYEGKPVYFLKRAQIFVSDLSFALPRDLPLANIEDLAIFADYKLPQILEYFGILKYTPELDARIVAEEEIPRDSLEEIELRAFTIYAFEQLAAQMYALGRDITTHELDWILWVKAKSIDMPKPHHKTRTTAY